MSKSRYYDMVSTAFVKNIDGEFENPLCGDFSSDEILNRVYQIIVFILAYYNNRFIGISGTSYTAVDSVTIIPLEYGVTMSAVLMPELQYGIFVHAEPIPEVFIDNVHQFDVSNEREVLTEFIDITYAAPKHWKDSLWKAAVDRQLLVKSDFRSDILLLDVRTGFLHDFVYSMIGSDSRKCHGRISRLADMALSHTSSVSGCLQVSSIPECGFQGFYDFLKSQEQLYIKKFSLLFQSWSSPLEVLSSLRLSISNSFANIMRVFILMSRILRDGCDLDMMDHSYNRIVFSEVLRDSISGHLLIFFLGAVAVFDSSMSKDFNPYKLIISNFKSCTLWKMLDTMIVKRPNDTMEVLEFKRKLWCISLLTLVRTSIPLECFYADPIRFYFVNPDPGWVDKTDRIDARYVGSPGLIEVLKLFGESYVCNSKLNVFPREIYEKILRYFIYSHGEHKLNFCSDKGFLMGRTFIKRVHDRPVPWYPSFRDEFNILIKGYSSFCGWRYWFPHPRLSILGSELCDPFKNCSDDHHYSVDDSPACMECRPSCEIQFNNVFEYYGNFRSPSVLHIRGESFNDLKFDGVKMVYDDDFYCRCKDYG